MAASSGNVLVVVTCCTLMAPSRDSRTHVAAISRLHHNPRGRCHRALPARGPAYQGSHQTEGAAPLALAVPGVSPLSPDRGLVAEASEDLADVYHNTFVLDTQD